MKRCLMLFFSVWSVMVYAQDIKIDYQSYRKELLNDYQEFRKSILDNYAEYLAGVWREYQSFKGLKRNNTPKPMAIPDISDNPTKPTPKTLPNPIMEPKDIHKRSNSVPILKPIEPTEPNTSTYFEFHFYGVTIKSIWMKTYNIASLEPSVISSVWKKYQTDKENKNVIQSLSAISQSYGLNDWFTFELVRYYVDELLKDGTTFDRIVLQHYILANLGFDIRIASTNKELLLLMPCKQQMYERFFLNIGGKKYYIFYDNKSQNTDGLPAIYTYDLPKNIYTGNVFDLMFHQYTLTLTSGDNKDCNLTDGRINVKGTVNYGMMEMLRHYPQTDIACYAASKVVPPFHNDILEQIKPQIAGMNQMQAANTLLHFVQYAFDYATDSDQHGYEKAYFIEENFYYPKNDCEDRAIFYAFLVHNLLGLDVHLVQFPGHECTAVKFTEQEIIGDSYLYNNKTYIICDPTYIGSYIGKCMPAYKNIKPKIEEWY